MRTIAPKYLILIFPIFILFYYFFKLHESLWEYFSLKGLKDLTFTITLEKLSFFLTNILFPIEGLPRSIIPLSYVITLIGLFSIRAGVRFLYENSRIVGFLDDDPKKIKKNIHGIKVLGPISSPYRSCLF